MKQILCPNCTGEMVVCSYCKCSSFLCTCAGLILNITEIPCVRCGGTGKVNSDQKESTSIA